MDISKMRNEGTDNAKFVQVLNKGGIKHFFLKKMFFFLLFCKGGKIANLAGSRLSFHVVDVTKKEFTARFLYSDWRHSRIWV
jgi:hypothetical protein